uniref:Peptidase M60 domain-containing protein n=1 Tax=Parasteatoda tepidariorum TaxID=114398 RepID=A0A2L2Y7Q5_PARTP
MTKGVGHHRTPVGIILVANQKLSCVLESKSLEVVEVRLLNDGEKTEGVFEIRSSNPGRAGTVSIGYVSVPFVDCEYLEKAPDDTRTVSISYPTDSKILPIYRFGDNESDFFKLWDTQDAEFAYVESDYFGLLIPKVDKEATRKLIDGQSLDDLIVFYDKIFTTYSELIGLSFEGSGTDQNVRNRFFLKADQNGSKNAMAYYGTKYSAVVSASIEEFWLDVGPTNWGALHEIGHGHQLHISDETLAVSEVWNNVLCFFYQAIMFGKKLGKKGSKIRDMEIDDLITYPLKEVKDWGLIERLSFLVHMFRKAGQKSLTRFHQLTRKEFDGTPFYASGLPLVEKLMHFFAIDFSIDVYPFMKLAKALIRKEQLYEHYYVLSSVAHPLDHILFDRQVLPDVQEKLGLLFTTGLVTPSDLSSTDIKNDFIINIEDKILKDLSGDTLKLMDGTNVVAERKIRNKTLILKDIPIGVYKVFVEPTRSNVKFLYDDFYAIVHDKSKSNELLLSAKVMKEPLLLPPDKINFIGWRSDFAYLSVEPFRHLVKFHFYEDEPHTRFSGEKYSEVTIKNQKNEVIFNKSINGDSIDVGTYVIPMEGELQIEIFHAETDSRLKAEDPMLQELIDRDNKTNYFIANERGLQKKETKKEFLEKRFLKKIDIAASVIKGKISLYDRPFCIPKYSLLLAVEAFERFFRNKSVDKSLRDKYKDCLPPPEKI